MANTFSGHTIQPAQKVSSLPASWTEKLPPPKKKCPKDYKKIREKYEKYFEGNRVLPIPELVNEIQPKTILFVVTDLKTRRLAGIKKKHLKTCFATWDVLLPSQDLAAKLAGDTITSKYFRLKPEYMGRRRIRITVCNVPIQLNEEVLAAYLYEYVDIEDITKAKSTNGDYIFTVIISSPCVWTDGGFTAIPHTLEYESQVMTVVVEGWKPQCWNCKQLGHFSKSCPQKTTKTIIQPTTTTTIITTIAAAATTTTKRITTATSESPKPETGDHPDKEKEGCTQVQDGGKKRRLPLKNQQRTK